MPKVLLDFPWDLGDLFNSYSPVLDVLRRFEIVRATHNLQPVPFVSQLACSQLFAQMPRPIGSGVFQHVRILLSHSLRQAEPGCFATLISGPADLSDIWRSALRDAMLDVEDWRNPQILFSEIRRGSWQPNGPEVGVRFEACEEQAVSGPYARVLACLEEYEKHRFATCDFDPWDLQRIHPPAAGAPAHQQYPCRLPKPPSCAGESLQSLEDRLPAIHNWRIGDNCYFVPPRGWRAENVSKQDWRDGKAFALGTLPNNHRKGPVDYKGEPWWWDQAERHWDVQLKAGGYWSISHTGRLLAEND